MESGSLRIAPKNVRYQRTAAVEGCAGGVLTFTPVPAEKLRGFNIYWGNASGEKLEDYTKIATVAHRGVEEVQYFLQDGLLIPEGAESFLIYPVVSAEDGTFFYEAEECAAAPLHAAPFKNPKERQYRFCVITDTHVTTDAKHPHNIHLENCFSELLKRAPDSIGIFSTGDTTDHGLPEEWDTFQAILQDASSRGLPPVYFAVGNHDLHFYKYHNELGYQTSFETQKQLFLKYTKTNAETFYHYEVIQGLYFIFLGPDRPIHPGENECYVHISEEEQAWLKNTLEQAAASGRPIFLFLHQSLLETVSGSLRTYDSKSQVWNGVSEDEALRKIVDRYPNLVMFTGHSHWRFDSKQPALFGNGNGANFVNASSVAYLWTDDNGTIENENNSPELGSEGYIVEGYPDYILLRGYDFAAKKWSATAQFYLAVPDTTGGK